MGASNHVQMRDPSPIAVRNRNVYTAYSWQRDPAIGDPKGDRIRAGQARETVRAPRAILPRRNSGQSSFGETSDDSEFEELTRPLDDLRHNCQVYMLQQAHKCQILNIRMQQKMKVLGVRHPDVFSLMSEVAMAWYRERHYVEAERLESQRLDLSIELYGPDADITFRCLRTLGAARTKLGRLEDAEVVYERGLRIAKKAGKNSDNCMKLHALLDLAETRSDLGRLEAAEPDMFEAWKLSQEKLEGLHGREILKQLGRLFFRQGRFKEATDYQNQAIEDVRQDHDGEECEGCELEHKEDLASTLRERVLREDSEEVFPRALQLHKELYGESTTTVSDILTWMGLFMSRHQRHQEAEDLHKQALGIREDLLGTDNIWTLYSMYNLALAIGQQRRYAEAAPLFEKVFDSRRELLGERDPRTLEAMTMLAQTLTFLRRLELQDEAQKLWGQLHALRFETLGEDDPATEWPRNRMAWAACEKKRIQFRKAWQGMPFINHPDIEFVPWLSNATQTDDPTRRLGLRTISYPAMAKTCLPF